MTINSIKRQIILFGLVICVLFLAQVYITMDPLKIAGGALHRYEKTMEQEQFLRELTTVVDKRHELVESLVKKAEKPILLELQDLQETANSHVLQLELASDEAEWTAAYKTLQEVHASYAAALKKLTRNLKGLATLREDLLVKSIKPILDILKEVKLLARTNQEQRNLQAINKTLTSIDKRLTSLMEKPPKKPNGFSALNQQMESITKPLAFLVRITESKPEMHTEMERVQTLILDYFASIHQLKNNLTERPDMIKAVDPQEKLMATMIHDLLQGLGENQKELFQSIYEESKLLKKNSLLFTGGLIILVAAFFIILLLTIRRPLKKLSGFLRVSDPKETDNAPFHSTLDEIQDLLEATDYLKGRLFKDIQKNFDHILKEDNLKIERKLDMLAASAVELSKVSSSIAKIPKIFDKKFGAIHKANDEARTHFRNMVTTCEALDIALKDVLSQATGVAPKTFDPLKEAVENVMSQAHNAAIEAQTLGLRFNSLVRTKDDTLEVSKLFSKAGTRVNQLARALREDVSQFFDKMRAAAPAVEEDAPTLSKDPKL